MDELYYNKPSEEFVETLEDVVAYRISLTDLLRLFETNIELANWGRVIHQNEYRRLHRSHKEHLTLSAKDRYEEFKQQFPLVCQRAQLGYIASYLGITLSTLSRLMCYLPGIDCGACGNPNCQSLAEDIVRHEAQFSDCIFMQRNMEKHGKLDQEHAFRLVEKTWGKDRLNKDCYKKGAKYEGQ